MCTFDITSHDDILTAADCRHTSLPWSRVTSTLSCGGGRQEAAEHGRRCAMYKARWWDEIVLDWGLHIDQDTYSKVGLSHTRRGPDSVERCFVPLDYTFVDFIVIG